MSETEKKTYYTLKVSAAEIVDVFGKDIPAGAEITYSVATVDSGSSYFPRVTGIEITLATKEQGEK